jgi:hypothetical protein
VTDTEVTARELAVAAARTVPRATPWRHLLVARVPLTGEGRTGRCKRCGRALPRFSDPIAFGPMGRFPVVRLERSTMESALLCLVCGPRSSAGRPFSRAEVIVAATELSAVLAARHWRRWNRLLDRAVATGDDAERIEQVGQVLELFRRFGPGKAARRRRAGGDPLEPLIVSSARHWPTRSGSLTE